MPHVISRRLGLALGFSYLCGTAGCALSDGGSGSTHAPTGGAAGSTAGTGAGGSPTGGTDPGGGNDGSVPPPMPPGDSCNLALPGSFTVHCSACHTQNGQANTRYPDLYKFQGSLSDFTMRVRTGSAKGMP